jgi:hypothetical protein
MDFDYRFILEDKLARREQSFYFVFIMLEVVL